MFQFLIENTTLKSYKIQLPVFFFIFFYFLLFYINFYSNYHFLWLFRISFNIYLKKIFITNFPFFNGFTKTTHPLNAEQLKSAKCDESFCWCCFLQNLSSWVTISYSVCCVTGSFILYLIVNDCHCLVAIYPML